VPTRQYVSGERTVFRYLAFPLSISFKYDLAKLLSGSFPNRAFSVAIAKEDSLLHPIWRRQHV